MIDQTAGPFRQFWPLAMILLLGLFLVALVYPIGVGEDPDTLLTVSQGLVWSEMGYRPSRTWGFPLFESYTMPMIQLWGEQVARLPAALFFLATLGLVYHFCFKTQGRALAVLATLGVCVVPIFHLAGSELIDTAQSTFLALAFALTILQARMVSTLPSWRTTIYVAILAGLMVSSRLDHIILCGAYTLAHIWTQRRVSVQLLVAIALTLLVVGVLYLSVYGFSGIEVFFRRGLTVVANEPWWRRAVRAVVGGMVVLGLPGTLLLLLAVGRRKLVRPAWLGAGEGLFLLLAALFYALRFVILPDEPAYILAPGLLVVIMLFCALPAGRWFHWHILLVAALAMPNLVQIALFKRENRQINLTLSLEPGAIYQDMRSRQYLLDEEESKKKITQQLKESQECDRVLDGFRGKYAPGSCLLISDDFLRYMKAGRPQALKKRVPFTSVRRVYLYKAPIGRQWRQMMPFTDVPPPDRASLKEFSPEALLPLLDSPVPLLTP